MNFVSAINAIYYRLNKDTKDRLNKLNEEIYDNKDINTFKIKIEDYNQRALVYNYLRLLGYNIDCFKSGMFEINFEKDFK